ncbi:MAG: cadherin-like domain-containing protein, partial [Verrucomicrobia bacterium]|nr:cadherin-like domain-containing protein [Verrucomicrobiota bacterium]
ATNFYGTVTFTYQVSDGQGGTATAVASITVYAPPVNGFPDDPQNVVRYQPNLSLLGVNQVVFMSANTNLLAVDDPDSTNLTITLSVTKGTLQVTNLSPAVTNFITFSNGVAGTNTLVLSGPKDSLNLALQGLTYTPRADYFGLDYLTMTAVDEGGRTDFDTNAVEIRVQVAVLGGIIEINDPNQGFTPTNVAIKSIQVIYDPTYVRATPTVLSNDTTFILEIIPVDGQNGAVYYTEITNVVTYTNLSGVIVSTETNILWMRIYEPVLTRVDGDSYYNSTFGTNGIPFGTPLFNPQTGLYEQKVQVVNVTPFEIKAFRLFATNLPAAITFYNAMATNDATYGPYVQFNQSLAAGAATVVTLEYFNRTYAPFTPGLKLTLLASPNSAVEPPLLSQLRPVTGTVQPIFGYTPDGRTKWYIFFPTQLGRTYYVRYTDDLLTWRTSSVPIQGNGSIMHWMDDGFPTTSSTPPTSGGTSSRFYTVFELITTP